MMRESLGKLGGVLGQLLAPLRYFMFFSVGKALIDFVFPAVAALVTCYVFSRVPSGVPIIGKDGFIASINGLLQILTGFFVAGLAAIFGASSAALDQAPIGFRYLSRVKRDMAAGAAVSRRTLLCALFGYLAFISFALYLVSVMANLCAPLWQLIPYRQVTRWGVLFGYLFVVWNIFFVTVYGLYYMVDRAHRADPILVDGPVD